jgi:hypothetical protein
MKRREKEGQGDEKFECEGKEEWARAIGRRGNSRGRQSENNKKSSMREIETAVRQKAAFLVSPTYSSNSHLFSLMLSPILYLLTPLFPLLSLILSTFSRRFLFAHFNFLSVSFSVLTLAFALPFLLQALSSLHLPVTLAFSLFLLPMTQK